MTVLIHAINSEIIAYPATMEALRLEFPNSSFPLEPTAEDLAPFNRFFVTPSPCPADTRTERPVNGATLTDEGWQQTWTMRDATPEETAAWDIANAPQPDWMEFGIDLAMHPGITALWEALPGPVSGALPTALNEAGKGDPRLFTGLWQRIMVTGAISPELLGGIATMAAEHHLPEAFIAGLAPAAPERERARDADGQFIADDPSTPDVDEAWV
jgi:hypothetical protein